MSGGRIALGGLAGPRWPWARLAARPQAAELSFGRVCLRPPRGRDWRGWAGLRAESRGFLAPWEASWPEDALSRSAFRARVRKALREQRAGTGYDFLVFRGGDETLLGGVSLANARRGVIQSGTLGYWIGERFARRGYMTEAVEAVLRFAFEELGLHRIEAACLPENAASRALLARCGFVEEGLARQLLRINGVWRDHITFAILREDWRRRARGAGRTAAENMPRGGTDR